MDGRKEKRISRTLRVLLSSGGQPVVAEYASTENVSSSGARVRTDRPWRPDSRVVIKSSQGDLWARARVVPCCATNPVEHELATNSVSQLLCGRDHRKFRCMRCNLPGNPACNRVVGCSGRLHMNLRRGWASNKGLASKPRKPPEILMA